MRFEQNRGQSDLRVRFIARGGGYTLFLTGDEAVLALRAASTAPNDGRRLEQARVGGLPDTRDAAANSILRMRFVGSNPAARIVGLDQLPGQTNYFVGNDAARWQRDVRSFARVRYEALYPGIDLVYYGNAGRLEYDLDVAPGASHELIRLNVEGAQGLELDQQGDLLIRLDGGVLRQHKPVAYQLAGNIRELVPAEYVLLGANQVGFHLADYDHARPLVIDPVLDYATYLGGENHDYAWDVAVDVAGNAYVTGATHSTGFPTTTLAFDRGCGTNDTCNSGQRDTYVVKLDPAGALVYATYIGGSHGDIGLGIAVDGAGSAYIMGQTTSTDFPTTTLSFDGQCGCGDFEGDVFVAKLTPNGDALVYSTYLGGEKGEGVNGSIAVDSAGQAFVVGNTYSSDFPTTEQAYDRVCGTSGDCSPSGRWSDAFITGITATGDALVYSSYLGGRDSDFPGGVAVDTAGAVYVAGETWSRDFPTTTRLYDPNCRSDEAGDNCEADSFVVKINPAVAMTESLTFGAILGGTGIDGANSIALDEAGHIYVTGDTVAHNFPTTVGAFDRSCSNDGDCSFSPDAFVVKINPAESGPAALLYSTYLGGITADRGWDIAIDDLGNAYVTGISSGNFPITPGAYDNRVEGSDGFVAVLNATGVLTSQLLYSTYLGGGGDDAGAGLALTEPEGGLYVAGGTTSTDFPTTTSALDSDCGADGACGGGPDAFLARLVLGTDLVLTKHGTPWAAESGGLLTYTLAITNNGPAVATAVLVTDTLPLSVTLQSVAPSQGSCDGTTIVVCEIGRLGLGDTVTISLTVQVDLEADGALVNRADVAGEQFDRNADNNKASLRMTLNLDQVYYLPWFWGGCTAPCVGSQN
ncbi:MAG TPA: SBBP repeat-containing protein [Ardenticatenaceae bacterium]|nr:SBBP repeat-containing protein [Ardenticatenaceae bacterium]